MKPSKAEPFRLPLSSTGHRIKNDGAEANAVTCDFRQKLVHVFCSERSHSALVWTPSAPGKLTVSDLDFLPRVQLVSHYCWHFFEVQCCCLSPISQLCWYLVALELVHLFLLSRSFTLRKRYTFGCKDPTKANSRDILWLFHALSNPQPSGIVEPWTTLLKDHFGKILTWTDFLYTSWSTQCSWTVWPLNATVPRKGSPWVVIRIKEWGVAYTSFENRLFHPDHFWAWYGFLLNSNPRPAYQIHPLDGNQAKRGRNIPKHVWPSYLISLVELS